MTYGHDPLHPVDAGAGSTRTTSSRGTWRILDSERRLAMIENALGHRRHAA